MNSNVAARIARLCILVKEVTVDGASRSATHQLGDPFLPESGQIRAYLLLLLLISSFRTIKAGQR